MGAVLTPTASIRQAIELVTVKEDSLNLRDLTDLDMKDASTSTVVELITADAIPQLDALIMEVVEHVDVPMDKEEEVLALIHAIHITKRIAKPKTVNMKTDGLNQIHTRSLKGAEA